jgi:hypothetical protein
MNHGHRLILLDPRNERCGSIRTGNYSLRRPGRQVNNRSIGEVDRDQVVQARHEIDYENCDICEIKF